MSKPITEPSTEKKMAALGFREDQVERRPAPQTGIASFPVISATLTTNVLVPHNTETIINWDAFNNGDATVFGETLVAGKLQKISFLKEGIYASTMVFVWVENFDDTHMLGWISDGPTEANWIETPNYGAHHFGFTDYQFSFPPVLTIVRRVPYYPLGAADLIGGIYARLLAKVGQLSGTDKNVSGGFWDISYLGPSASPIP